MARRPLAAIVVSALGLVACAHAAHAPPKVAGEAALPPRVAVAVNDALALAQQLPAGADRCAVVRPGMLSAEHAALFSQISQAESFAWLPGLGVSAYAGAQRSRRESRAASVSVLRFSVDAAQARVLLDSKAGLDLRWGGGAATACEQARCPTFARFVDAHTLLLERGAWSAPTTERGSERACVLLASQHADAVEVAARRNESLFVDGPSELPIETRTHVTVTPESAAFARDDLMQSSEAAERLVTREASVELFGMTLGGGLDLSATRTREDLLVHTFVRVRWDDLSLRAGDAERMARAARYTKALADVHADAAIDLTDIDSVMRELAARQALARESTADRAALTLELAALLDRALALHPDDPRLRAARGQFPPNPGESLQVTAPGRPAMTPP